MKLITSTHKLLLLQIVFSSLYVALPSNVSLVPFMMVNLGGLGVVITLSFFIHRTSVLLLLTTLALSLLLQFGLLRALDRSNLTYSLPCETLVQLEGALLADSSITAQGETLIQCRITSCTDRRGKKTNASGVATLLIKDARNLFWPATIKAESLSFSENVIVAKRIEEISEQSSLWCWRQKLYENLNQRLEGLHFMANDLARQLLLGKSDQDSTLIRTLSVASGSAHVLALSGMHVTLLAMTASLLLKPLLGRQGALAASTIVILLFLFIAGPKPSLVRSALMFFILQCGGEEKSASLALIVTFFLQLWLTPTVATSAAFTLSYASLAAILLVVPVVAGRLAIFIPQSLSTLIITSSGALAATAPISLALFGAWYPIGIVLSPLLALIASAFMLIALFYLALPHPWIATGLHDLSCLFMKVATWGNRWSEIHHVTTGAQALRYFYLLMLTLLLLLSYARTQIRTRSHKRYDLGFSLRFTTSSQRIAGARKFSSE